MWTARFSNFLRGFELKSTGKWFLLATLVGSAAGIGAVLFQLIGQVVVQYTLVEFAGWLPGEAAGEHSLFEHESRPLMLGMIVVVMGLGGLVSGWLVYTFAPEAEGHGTDAAIESFHHKRGVVRPMVPVIKTLASAITIGTGGSAGREGPIAQIGAGVGSLLATRFGLSDRDRRIMLAAGMAAGIGAIFRAPLAGALFAAEILYKDADIESEVIVPAAISSIVSYSVYSLCLDLFLPTHSGFLPLFGNDLHYELKSLFDLIPLALMSVLLVLAAIAYIRTFYGIHALSKKLTRIPNMKKPAIGATLAGLIGIGLHSCCDTSGSHAALAVLSTGYGSLQTALEDPAKLGIGALLLIAAGKVLTTSLTISTGGSGGVFGPSMVIGGCVGAAIGLWFQDLFGIDTQPGAYAIVGMAGFFAGAAHAPISTIIMVSEMTGDYQLLLPTMWVSTLCYLLCRRWTLYEKQVPTRLESPAHKGDFIVDILDGMYVRDVFSTSSRIMTIPESASLDEIVHLLAETHQHYFPVVDANDNMVGIFTDDDVRAYLFDETIWKLAVARDVMVTHVVTVTPEDDLNTALQRFTSVNLEELPVVDLENSRRLLGRLTRRETIAFYNRRLMQHKQGNG